MTLSKRKSTLNFCISILCFAFIIFYSTGCQNSKGKNINEVKGIPKDSITMNKSDIRLGKLERDKFDSIFIHSNIDTFELPFITKELAAGLHQQLKLLKYQKNLKKEYSGIALTKSDLEETIKILLTAQFDNSFGIKKGLEAHQIWGDDKKGNVRFTGYFTPVLKVKKEPDAQYRYPLYKYPKKWNGALPTRGEIEGEGVLDTFNLEIAYAKNKIDIYFMQVQGSGYIEFPNGEKVLLAHAGTNKQPYRSIGKYMVENGYTTPEYVSLKSIRSYFKKNPELVDSILFINPSYIFFTPVKTNPRGAGHVALTPEYSIAVDKKVIPLGSCLLASIPMVDENRNFTHHEYRILLAQDVGGAIKGTGHVDLYRGIGKNAEKNASALHHYGNIWLLLPKDTLTLK